MLNKHHVLKIGYVQVCAHTQARGLFDMTVSARGVCSEVHPLSHVGTHARMHSCTLYCVARKRASTQARRVRERVWLWVYGCACDGCACESERARASASAWACGVGVWRVALGCVCVGWAVCVRTYSAVGVEGDVDPESDLCRVAARFLLGCCCRRVTRSSGPEEMRRTRSFSVTKKRAHDCLQNIRPTHFSSSSRQEGGLIHGRRSHSRRSLARGP